MGFDNECILNIQSLPGEYFCPVCRTLVYPNEALQTQCTHLYCNPCLAYVVATTRACPYDGYLVTEVDSKPLIDSNKAIAEAINKIQVHCLYHRSGCQWQGSLADCSTHCTECSYGNSPVVCNRCGTQIIHRQVQEHAQICPGVQPQTQLVNVGQNQGSTEQNQGTHAISQTVQDPSSQSAAAATTANVSASTAIPANTPAASAFTATHANAGAQPQVSQAQSQEQWYQQQQQQQLQYQQYYQQYPGYDPYQQQQQVYAQYYSQPQVGQTPQQAVPYAQSQPQLQPPVYQANLQPVPQQTVQPQAQPQLQPQSQPQLQPQTQPQPQLQSQVPMPQMQALPNAQQQFAVATQQAHLQAQVQPQANLPQAQMATQPVGSLPAQTPQQPQHQLVVQHYPTPQMTQPQMQPQVPPQVAQQLPVQSQQHLNPLAQPQPQTVNQSLQQMHPLSQNQPQSAPAHAVSGHQSYPQPQLQQTPTAVPQQRTVFMHPQQTGAHQQLPQHPTLVQNQVPHQMAPVRPLHSQVSMQVQQPTMTPPRPGYYPSQPAAQQQPQFYPGMQSSSQNHTVPHQQVRGQVPPQQGTFPSQHALFPQQPLQQQAASYGQHHLPSNQPAQQPTSMMPSMPMQHAQTAVSNKTTMTNPTQSSVGQVASAAGASGGTTPITSEQVAGKAPEANNLAKSVIAPNDVSAASEMKTEKQVVTFSSGSSDKKPSDGEGNIIDSGALDRDHPHVSQHSQDLHRNGDSVEPIERQSDKTDLGGKLKEQSAKETVGRLGNAENKTDNTLEKTANMNVQDGLGDEVSNMQSEAEGSARLRRLNSLGKTSDLVGQSNLQQGETHGKPNFQSGYPDRRQTQFPPQAPPAVGSRAAPPPYGQTPLPTGGSRTAPPPYGQAPPLHDGMLRPPMPHAGSAFQGPPPHQIQMQGPNYMRPPAHGISENMPYQGQPPAPGPYRAEVPPSGFSDPGLSTAVRGQPPHPAGGRIPPGDMYTGPPNGMPPESLMIRGHPPGPEGPLSQTHRPFGMPRGITPNKVPGSFESRQTEHPYPAAMEHGSLGQNFVPHSNMLGLNAPPEKMAEPMPFPGPGSERFAGSTEGRHRPFPDEGYKRLADDPFKPFPVDSARRIDRRELEEDLKQFPRHPSLSEGFSKFDNFPSRPLDRGPFGWGLDSGSRTFDKSSSAFGPDGVPKIDGLPGAISSRLPPPYHSDSFPGDRPSNDDSVRKFEFEKPHMDTGVPGREFGGIPFSRSESGSGSHGFSRFDDYHGRDSQIFGERPRPFNLSSDPVGNDRPPLSSSQDSERTRMIEQFGSGLPRPNEFGGPDFMRNSFHSGEPLGSRVIPGSGSPRGFQSHFPGDEPGRVVHNRDPFGGEAPMRFGDPSFSGNFHSHAFPLESGPFNLGGAPQDDLYPSDSQRKRKPGSAGWCRICKIDCENIEGLELHSQTREHQRMAMDIVLNIKKNNAKKKKKSSEDNMFLHDASKMKFSSFESRGNKI